MEKIKKTRIFLSVLLAVALLVITVFAVWAYSDLRRESELIAAQPGSSGVDYLGVALASSMLIIMLITLTVSIIDIYACLMYFLTSQKKNKRKRVMNAISLVFSLVAMLSVPLFFVGQFELPLVFGLVWALVCPIYRLVYAAINAARG